VRQRHEQVADGRQRRRDADEARLVAAEAEISDEHDHRHVHDVVAGQHQAGLGAAQSKAAFQRPDDARDVRVAHHPEQHDAADCESKQRHGASRATAAAAGVSGFHRGLAVTVRHINTGMFHTVMIVPRRCRQHCQPTHAHLLPLSIDLLSQRHDDVH